MYYINLKNIVKRCKLGRTISLLILRMVFLTAKYRRWVRLAVENLSFLIELQVNFHLFPITVLLFLFSFVINFLGHNMQLSVSLSTFDWTSLQPQNRVYVWAGSIYHSEAQKNLPLIWISYRIWIQQEIQIFICE